MNTYTANARGQEVSVSHDLTDEACRQLILKSDAPSGFALDMARTSSPSEKQRAWLHILADELVERPEVEGEDNVTLPRIAGLFAQALDKGAKRLSIRIDGGAIAGVIVLRLNKKRRINITDDAAYGERRFYGSIGVDRGDVRIGRDCNGLVTIVLGRFEANPIEIACEYGRLHGECCFCALELTDERSVLQGYGPICAEKYGLPWGERLAT